MSSILIIDDEKNIRVMTSTVLSKKGFHAAAVEDGPSALAELKASHYDLVLLDYMLSGMDGFSVLEEIRKLPEPPAVIFMTAYGSVDTAVSAMRAGASDYMSKPFTSDELLHVIGRNLRTGKLEREVRELRERVAATEGAARSGIVAQTPAMRRVVSMAEQVASSKAPILIEGETGTGKELLARLIHELSPRAGEPFIAVNCGALHPELLLSELFGHRRGAFTGAIEDRIGRFEAADGGTLFLDEIGELDPSAQSKLLRVLQENTFERLGDPRLLHVDVRVIAATNRRLEDMVNEGTFRSDLFYRIVVVRLTVPPLRERVADILPLAEAFLQEYSQQEGKKLTFSPEAKAFLTRMRWPGNVRELRNAVHRAILLTPADRSLIRAEDFVENVPPPLVADVMSQAETELWSIEEVEREYMRRLLLREDLNLTDVCRILKIDPATLWRKRKKYEL